MFVLDAATPTNTHPPHEGRQPETTGDKTLQSPRRRPHQPTPTPRIKGDNRRQPETMGDNGRQWETTGDKTTSEPKKPTTPTNTKAARSKVALRTPTVNCLGNKNPYPHSLHHFGSQHESKLYLYNTSIYI